MNRQERLYQRPVDQSHPGQSIAMWIRQSRYYPYSTTRSHITNVSNTGVQRYSVASCDGWVGDGWPQSALHERWTSRIVLGAAIGEWRMVAMVRLENNWPYYRGHLSCDCTNRSKWNHVYVVHEYHNIGGLSKLFAAWSTKYVYIMYNLHIYNRYIIYILLVILYSSSGGSHENNMYPRPYMFIHIHYKRIHIIFNVYLLERIESIAVRPNQRTKHTNAWIKMEEWSRISEYACVCVCVSVPTYTHPSVINGLTMSVIRNIPRRTD